MNGPQPINVLLLQDGPGDTGELERMLSGAQHQVWRAGTRQTGPEQLARDPIDVVLLVLSRPDVLAIAATEAINQARQQSPGVPMVVLASRDDEMLEIEVLRQGVQDYLVQDQSDPDRLTRALRRAIQRGRAEATRWELWSRVERAKQEWESTVDSLPQLICLVDQQGNILRTNRTVERWQLAAVTRVKGQKVHALLHPGCTAPMCYLDNFLHQAWTELSRGQAVELESKDPILNRHLHIQVRPTSMQRTGSETAETTFAAITIYDITARVQSEESLRRYAAEQAALYAVSSAVATVLDPDELLDTVLRVVVRVLEADAGWVVLPDASLDRPGRLAASLNLPDPFRQACTSFPLHDCPLYTPSLQKSPRVRSMTGDGCVCISEELWASAGLRYHVGIPLTAGHHFLGLLNVAWHAHGPDAQQDTALMTAIGQQVGLALRNAQLYQSARQVDRLRVLNELDQALTTSLNPNTIAEVALHRVAAALNVSAAALVLIPPLPGKLSVQMVTLSTGWIKLDLPQQAIEHLISWLQNWGQTLPLPYDEMNKLIATVGPSIGQRLNPGDLIVPILVKGEVIAVLGLLSRSCDRPFSGEDRALVQTAATRIGQAIQNARLYLASQERAQWLAILNEISAAAVSSIELDTMLRQIIERTCHALDAAEGSILLREQGTEALYFAVALTDGASDLQGQRLAPGQGIAGWVAQHNQPLCINNVHDDPRWHSEIDTAIGFKTHSMLCAPLVHQGEITGVIEIVNKHDGDFDQEDLDLLVAVASIAASALDNARLYAATRAYADRTAHLYQIGQTLSSTLDYDTVVQAAVIHIQSLFQADSVLLFESIPDRHPLRLARALVGDTLAETLPHLPAEEGFAEWALRHSEPVLVDDAQDDPRYSVRLGQALNIRIGTLMAVPLLTPDREVGVITVISSTYGVYGRNELNILQAVASTLAVALENARLYAEQKQLLWEREQAQARLIQSEKMAALGRLAGSIAHEINNPLQATQNSLMLLDEELTAKLRSEEVRYCLDVAGKEINRIATIVRRMRDFYYPVAQPNSTRYQESDSIEDFYRLRPQELKVFDVQEALESVLQLTNKQLQHHNVAVERQWARHLPAIEGNPDYLRQVFLNLVLNAIDAMPVQGGTLHVSTALDYMEEPREQAQPSVRVEFSDTGVGMSPEVQSRLFEPLFTTKVYGSGFGLFTCYKIIEAHRGRITVQSHVGLGTTFTILLPARQT